MHKRLICAAAWPLLAAAPAMADVGIAARFGDVVLEGIQPGHTYNLREQVSLPFAVENRGDAETTIYIEMALPREGTMAKGYEAIPDPGWLKAIPDKLTVAPHALGYCDLLLSVPDDPALQGKNYQITIKARTAPSGMLALQVENKLRFSIGPGPESLQAEKKLKAMQKLDFDITPKAIYLKDVPLGRRYDAKKEGQKTIRIANFADADLAVTLASHDWDRRFDLPEGYEPMPVNDWISFKTSTVTVSAGEIGQALFYIQVPDEPKNRGRKFAAFIRTGLEAGFWLDSPVQVFFETQK